MLDKTKTSQSQFPPRPPTHAFNHCSRRFSKPTRWILISNFNIIILLMFLHNLNYNQAFAFSFRLISSHQISHFGSSRTCSSVRISRETHLGEEVMSTQLPSLHKQSDSNIENESLFTTTKNDPEKAELILLQNLKENQTTHTMTEQLNAILQIYAANQSLSSHKIIYYATRAYQLLKFVSMSHPTIPNQTSFYIVLEALSQSAGERQGGITSAQQASELLKLMNRMYKRGDGSDGTKIRPDALCYTLLMEAWAKSGDEASIQRVKALFKHLMESYARTSEEIFQPNVRTWNAVLLAWSKSEPSKKHKEECVKKAQEFFTKMETSYNDGSSSIQPNVESYNYLMETWAESGSSQSCTQVENLFREMTDEKNIQPNVETYNAILNAYAKNSQNIYAPIRTIEILRHMEQMSVEPNTKTYNKIIHAWSRGEEHGGNAQRAEEMLQEMEERYSENGISGCKPNARSYTSVISAWARSHTESKAKRAYDILKKMIVLSEEENDEGIRPDVPAYNAVLNACALSGDADLFDHEKKEVLKLAITTFRELCHSKQQEDNDMMILKPDHVTYGIMLKCVANLMPKEDVRKKDEIAEMLFLKCCQEGQVGDVVLKQLRTAASPELHWKIMREKGLGPKISKNRILKVRDVPSEWSRNVREGRGHRKRK